LAIGFSGKKCFLARFSGLLTVIFLVALGYRAFGQQTLGSINGTVTDSTGAVIQGAQVKARATATNLEVQATSKTDGSFSMADLPGGGRQRVESFRNCSRSAATDTFRVSMLR
jgi:hypothetical protein